MKKDVIVSKLKGLGLSEKESQVYLSTLELGQSPASEIAENATMNRVTVYGLLEDLCIRGYIERSEIHGAKHYTAISPQILLEEAKARTNSFEESLPMLLMLQGSSEIKPHVRMFEGLEEVKKAYQITLSAQSEILNFANSNKIRAFWPNYQEEYISDRKAKGIWLRGLYPEDEDGREVQDQDEQEYRETRLIDHKYFSAENEIKMFDNQVLIVSYTPQPFAILIESSTVYETQKQIFEMVWGFAKTPSKKWKIKD